MRTASPSRLTIPATWTLPEGRGYNLTRRPAPVPLVVTCAQRREEALEADR